LHAPISPPAPGAAAMQREVDRAASCNMNLRHADAHDFRANGMMKEYKRCRENGPVFGSKPVPFSRITNQRTKQSTA
jgi:hypothetical protein